MSVHTRDMEIVHRASRRESRLLMELVLPYALGSLITSGLGVAFAARAGRTLLIIGGLGLGLAAPILVNVVLAGVPGRDAGAAGGVLSTVNQVGGAVGIAVLGTIFFASVTGSATGAPALPDYSHAFGIVLVVSAALYLITALVMLALPKAAIEHAE
ncbi:hypothetical protein ABZ815_19150 [Nonomuraea sp. NPDC047529]|uniref:hypothetical protein n=1 Tax=Nonomuraea sp. NPDC047529 TaxID=3155623 RepID=UPI00340D8C46